MSKYISVLMGLAFLAAFSVLQPAAVAGAWDSAHLFDSPDKTVQTLVVTGNFTNPRLIAELVRKAKKTPYLLFPAPDDSRIFFNPGGKGPALEIREADVGRFVEFINPKQIIVLGDGRFVPQHYIAALDAKCEVVVIDSGNWFTNATTIGNYLDYKALPEKYIEALAKYEAKAEPSATKSAPSVAPAMAPAGVPPAIESSPEPMILMPPSQGVDEPVLLVPQSSAPVPKRVTGK